MTGLLIEFVLGLVGIGLLVALIWLIFDYRALKVKQADDREEFTRALAALGLRIDRLEGIRMGPGTRP